MKRNSWETILESLKDVGPRISQDPSIKPVLDALVSEVSQYVPLSHTEGTSLFHVTDLTRESLRKALCLFLSSNISNWAQPFANLGNGTANILVFALLSAISGKRANVLFAMEEPEIALPPYIQRRIVTSLKEKVQQCLFTSHSPYIAEHFLSNELLVLQRNSDHTLESHPIVLPEEIKSKNYSREFRQKYAEGIISRGVLAVEGDSDLSPLYLASSKLEEAGVGVKALDLLGVTVIGAGGHGNMPAIGSFFNSVGIKTFAFHDKLDNGEAKKIEATFDIAHEHPFKGIESLLASSLPLAVLQQFISRKGELADWPSGEQALADNAKEDDLRSYVQTVLCKRKGSGYTSFLIDLCAASEIPAAIRQILTSITEAMSQPQSAEHNAEDAD